MARIALDNLLLGLHGEILEGHPVPETYEDIAGVHDTDFDRLEELGLVSDGKPVPVAPPAADTPADTPAAKPKPARKPRARKSAAKPKPAK